MEWKAELRKDPEYQAVYDEEAAKSELWLQLVEARQKAGLTQAQMAERLGITQSRVAKIEKEGYSLEVRIHHPDERGASQDSASRHTHFAPP